MLFALLTRAGAIIPVSPATVTFIESLPDGARIHLVSNECVDVDESVADAEAKLSDAWARQ